MILVEAVKRILYYIKRVETLLAAEIERAKAVENEVKESMSTAIVSGEQTETSDEDGGVNVYAFKDASGKTSEFTVKNGSKGSKGDTGAQGLQGDKGDTGATGATGAKGDKGDKGDTGNGISSITEHYAVSTSNTTAPASWGSSVPNMTATNKYLWNYETITYTNGSTVNTAKRVIGVYGDKGDKGDTGDTGPTTTTLTDQDYTVNSSGSNGFKVNNTSKANSYAKLFADGESGTLELGSSGGTYGYHIDCKEDSFIRMYCFQRSPWKFMSNWVFTKDGDFKVKQFIENGTALAEKYQAKGSYAAADHTHSYLPLSGGTMTGDVTFSSSDKRMMTIHDTRGYTDRSVDILNGASVASIQPTTDLAVALSTSTSKRWKYVYAQYMYVSSGTAVTSDRNLKNTIDDLDAEMSEEFIMGLRPSSYKYNESESGRTHFGLIAQDVEETLKEIGLTTKDFAGLVIENEKSEDGNEENKTYALRYEEFMAPLIKVVQMQQKTIENLEERLSKLENQILDNK